MNAQAMLDELMKERAKLDEAITVLQRLAAGRGARRGRPPKCLVEARKAAAAKK